MPSIFRCYPSSPKRLGKWSWVALFLVTVCCAGSALLAQNKAKDGARVDDKGRKFVNKIPYDVFFDKPLEIVSSHRNAVSVAKPTDVTVSTPTASPTAAQAAVVSGSGIVWQDLLPIDELQGEVKIIRNDLTKWLSNPGQFNQNFKSIAVDGAEMAALAVIVQERQESLGWKDKAAYVREFGTQINRASTGFGKENFDKSKSAFQRLIAVLDGSIPADAGEVADRSPIQEAVSRKGLMKRIEKAKDWLKQEINSDSKFRSKVEDVRHEAAILAALATVVTMSGYDYTENSDYQSFAKSLVEGAKEASAATTDDSFDKFKLAIDKINKSCTDCHGAYGNG